MGSKVQELEGLPVAAANSSGSGLGRLHMAVAVGLVVALTDLLVWRAAVGGMAYAAVCTVLAIASVIRRRSATSLTSAQWLALGFGTALLSFVLGLAVDQANEHAARSLATKVAGYKAEHGSYPSAAVGNGWASPVLGYTQRYTLTGSDEARVWFVRFNHRLQSLVVASGQLEQERDQ